jgi:putative effector of murein hydrolase
VSELVELWVYLASTPLFGLAATLVVYVLMQTLHLRLDQAPWSNPVLGSVLVLGTVLVASGTAYEAYFAGAQFIHVLLGPAVVALGWPLWQRRTALRRQWRALLAGAVLGGGAAAGSAVLLGWALGLPPAMLASLAPKSVTAPVAMGLASQLGGIPALAAVLAVLTGLSGAVMGRYLFDALGLRAWPVRGFALGTAAHGLGAARALQVHPDAGAWAGLGLGLQVVVASLAWPLVAGLLVIAGLR